MLPPRSFLPGYLVRGGLLWIAIHIGVAFVASASGVGPAAGGVSRIVLPPAAAPLLLGAVFLASYVDDRVRRDHLFLANLGVSPAASAAASAAAALALEVCLQLVTRSA